MTVARLKCCVSEKYRDLIIPFPSLTIPLRKKSIMTKTSLCSEMEEEIGQVGLATEGI